MNTNKVEKIISLHASWCAPCKMFTKTFEQVRKDEKYKDIKFESYDIEDGEKGSDITEKYMVRSVPTTILLDKEDNPIKKVIGNVPEKDFTDIINDCLSESKELKE